MLHFYTVFAAKMGMSPAYVFHILIEHLGSGRI